MNERALEISNDLEHLTLQHVTSMVAMCTPLQKLFLEMPRKDIMHSKAELYQADALASGADLAWGFAPSPLLCSIKIGR